jgi:benzylsuccinate CoA-transferase BbsE subunit
VGGALAGRRVLELADENGVYCGKLLADLGADVIKVERPGGDATRLIPPFWGGRPDPDRGLFFLYANTSKRSITLDPARPEGRALLLRLVRTADLLVETLAPGALDELGLGYPVLREIRPPLVLTSITGFGQTGPRRSVRSGDLVAQALAGALYVTGEPQDPPVRLAGGQARMMASTCAAASSLVALHASRRTGRGQHVDISMQEVMASVSHISGVGKWLDDGLVPRRFGTALFASVPSGAYRCRDGLVYLMVNRPLHWKALASWIHEVTGNQEVLDPMFEGPSSNRQPYRELIDLFISDLTARFPVEDVYREAQRRHIAVTPVNSAQAVTRDEQLEARGYFVTVQHPEAGPLRYPGAPYRHAATPWRIARCAPRPGEHNREVYVDELGVSEAQLREYARGGVV